jgi:DNA mismatch repair protein MutS
LSLAFAISEHIAGEVKCRTLFATHYHELTDLARQYKGVRNLNVAVREWQDQVIFLHRIVEGGTDRSYGIHVARLAGVPKSVLARAKELLGQLAVHHVGQGSLRRRADDNQMDLFGDPSKELLDQLRSLNLDNLAPRQALDLLQQWKDKLK